MLHDTDVQADIQCSGSMLHLTHPRHALQHPPLHTAVTMLLPAPFSMPQYKSTPFQHSTDVTTVAKDTVAIKKNSLPLSCL